MRVLRMRGIRNLEENEDLKGEIDQSWSEKEKSK